MFRRPVLIGQTIPYCKVIVKFGEGGAGRACIFLLPTSRTPASAAWARPGRSVTRFFADYPA